MSPACHPAFPNRGDPTKVCNAASIESALAFRCRPNVDASRRKKIQAPGAGWNPASPSRANAASTPNSRATTRANKAFTTEWRPGVSWVLPIPSVMGAHGKRGAAPIHGSIPAASHSLSWSHPNHARAGSANQVQGLRHGSRQNQHSSLFGGRSSSEASLLVNDTPRFPKNSDVSDPMCSSKRQSGGNHPAPGAPFPG